MSIRIFVAIAGDFEELLRSEFKINTCKLEYLTSRYCKNITWIRILMLVMGFPLDSLVAEQVSWC